MTWIDDARDTINTIAWFYPLLDKVGGLTNQYSTETARHVTLASPQLPIDPRPIDLGKDVRRFAEHSTSLARGTLRTGQVRIPATVARLTFLAGVIQDLDQADPELVRDIAERWSNEKSGYESARRLLRRWDVITHPLTEINSMDSYPFIRPCPECGGTLRAHRHDWSVRCDQCQGTWTLDVIQKTVEAVPA